MPLPVTWTVELYQAGAWVDITNKVREDPGIIITFGIQGEGGTADANTASMTVNYWADVPRGTPLRIKVGSTVRFLGEVSEFPVRWEESGNVVWVPLVASGILRRLAHSSLLDSTLVSAVRGLIKAGKPINGYWPVEDSAGATSIGSAIVGGVPGSITGSPTFGAVDPGVMSREIPTWDQSSAIFIPPGATATAFTAGCLAVFPAAGKLTGGEQLFRVDVYTGTYQSWRLLYSPGSGGGIILQVLNNVGVEVYATVVITGLDGKTTFLKLECANSGANVNWALTAIGVGFNSGTFVTASVGAVQFAQIGGGTIAIPAGSGFAAGHVILGTTSTAIFDANFDAGLRAYAGETVANRMTRLATQTGITITVDTGYFNATELGAQQDGTLLDVLRQAEKADAGGILRDNIGSIVTAPALNYTPRTYRYNDKPPLLALTYTSGHLSAPLEPVKDDQNLTNDVTAERIDGSSARAYLASGSLSVQDYPNGVGPYPTADSYGVYLDAQLPYLASWLLGLGTVDETRWPALTVDLVKNPSLVTAFDALRPGCRVTIASLPAWAQNGVTTATLQVIGWRESISSVRRTVELVCVPGSPWFVVELDDTPYGELDVMTLAY